MDTLGKSHIAIFGIKYFPSRGGTSRVVESLLRNLKDEYTFTIYCYEHPKAKDNIPNVRIVSFPEPGIRNFGVFFYFCKCLLHLMIKGKYDLVHVHKTEASFFAPLIRLRFPTIITSHEIPYKNNKWSWLGKAYFHLAEWVFMHSGATRTSISKTQSDFYQEKYGKKVLYIPNGIENPKLANQDELQEFLQRNDVKDEFILFAARRIIPIKGCHHLINALKKIGYNGQIVIAGDTTQMKQYTNELIRNSKGLQVKFVGFIESSTLLNALVKKAGLFIFPSEIEGMSMMLLEVAALRTPIICSDIDQNKVILDDSHVLFFESQNSDDLAEKITYAIGHPEAMNQKALTASEYVAKNYSVRSIVTKYIDLYNRHLIPKKSHEYTHL